ncbi:MAG: hypothetical protein WD184_00555 [Acidimicrobiia bacterium]
MRRSLPAGTSSHRRDSTSLLTGHVICTELADIRGGEPISFTAVFDHADPPPH